MPFSIVWQPFEGRSPTGRPLADVVSYPYFVDGEAHEALIVGHGCELTFKGLLFGILVAARNGPPLANYASTPHLSDTLRDLMRGFGAVTLEQMLLDASAMLREAHGDALARTALSTAHTVLPESAMIRSDLINTCWALLKDTRAPHEELLQQIDVLYRQKDLILTDPNAGINAIFAKLVALSLLPGRQSAREALVRSGVLVALNGPWYHSRVQYLFSDPHPTLAGVL